MTNICINVLCGIPASGKSTFCERLQRESQTFNVIHICYDHFIRMPESVEHSNYFESKQYKKDRFALKWLIQQLIDDIKDGNDFNRFRQALSDFPHVHFDLKTEFLKKYFLLLIDDTMHYKSMRKEIRTLARDNGIGYFVTYFSCTLATAIERNRNRVPSVDEKQLQRLHAIIETPTEEECEIVQVNTDDEISANFVEQIASKCVEYPLQFVPAIDHPVVEQSVLHQADLVLRRSINRKMTNYKHTNRQADLSVLAKALCAKRLFVLQEIRMGRVDVPENVNDLRNLIGF